MRGPLRRKRSGLVDADRAVLRLALPALATLLAEPVYVLTDTAIVGHLGTNQLAGLALATTILLSGYAIFVFLAYGTTSSVSRLLGARRDREAADQAVQGLWLAVVLGVAVAGTVGVTGSALVGALGGRGEVAADALVYLRVSLAGFPALLVSLAGVGYLRGLQDTRTPLLAAMGTAALNLVLEVVLIFGLGFGLGASALATVVAQWVAAAVYVARVGRAVRERAVPLAPRWSAMRSLLGVGVHLLVRTVALRSALVLGTAAAARQGREELAGYQVGFEIWTFLTLALDALAIAAQALVGRALGAGDVAGARAVGRRVNRWGVMTGLAFGLGLAALRWPLAGLFSGDDAVVAAAAWSLTWVALSQPLNGWVYALDGTLIGAGDQRYLAGAMAVAFGLYAPLAWWVGTTRAGLGWVWAALLGLMAARLGALQLRFVGDRWAVAGASRAG